MTAKIQLLLFFSLVFFLLLLHQVAVWCCLASSRSWAGSLAVKIISALVFVERWLLASSQAFCDFADLIPLLQTILPRALPALSLPPDVAPLEPGHVFLFWHWFDIAGCEVL